MKGPDAAYTHDNSEEELTVHEDTYHFPSLVRETPVQE